MRFLRLLLPALVMFVHVPLHAQDTGAVQAQGAVVPQGITVGDVFHAVIRADLGPRGDIVAPDSLPLPPQLELAGARQVTYDTVGGRTATVRYPLVAWSTGTVSIEPVTINVVDDGSARAVVVALPQFDVRSVLPPDTTGIEAKGAKDVLGPNRVWWPLLVLAVLLLAAAIALYIWWRRRRPAPVDVSIPAPVIPARQAALAALHVLRSERLVEAGRTREHYERLALVMRRYAESLEPRWSADLTTAELGSVMQRAGAGAPALELLRILGSADLVKFARAVPPPSLADADVDAAIRWVERADAAIDPNTLHSRSAA